MYNLLPVSSTRMTHVGHSGNTMYIQFNDGSVYSYANVSHAEYIAFINSPSLGHELVSFQRAHPYSRVR